MDVHKDTAVVLVERSRFDYLELSRKQCSSEGEARRLISEEGDPDSEYEIESGE